jgi:hypothetical protein
MVEWGWYANQGRTPMTWKCFILRLVRDDQQSYSLAKFEYFIYQLLQIGFTAVVLIQYEGYYIRNEEDAIEGIWVLLEMNQM